MKEIPGDSSFNHVARHGKRCSSKSDQSCFWIQLAAHKSKGLHHTPKIFFWISDMKPFHIFRISDGLVDHRSFTLGKLEVYAHALEGQQNIGKDNCCVHFKAADRLESDLLGHFRSRADLQKSVFLAQFSILLHITTRLAHEPDRSAVHFLAPAGFQKPRIFLCHAAFILSHLDLPRRSFDTALGFPLNYGPWIKAWF